MDNFFRFFRREAKTASGKNTTVSTGSFKSNIIYANTDESAMRIAAVYRAVNLISGAVATLTLQYKRRDRAKNYFKIYDNGYGARVNYLLSVRPNDRMNSFTMMKYLVAMMLLKGNAYIYPKRAVTGEVESLFLCSPGSVVYDVYSNTYTVSDLVNGISGTFPASEILHFKNMCMDGGYMGRSTVSYIKDTLSIATTANNETLKRFATGGRLKAILQNNTSVKGFGEYQDKELDKQGQDLQEDINKGEDILVVRGDGTLTPISMSSSDMQFLEMVKLNLRDIARAFNVPPSKLMDDTNANYKSVEMSNVGFYTEALQPIITEIEREFTAKMLSVNTYMDYKFSFNLSSLYALDVDSRGKANLSRLGTGQATVNDIRRENDKEPVEKGDEVYLSTNLAVLGSAKLSKEGSNTIQTSDVKKKEEEDDDE
ncbi:phage portal protein [Bacteroides sp.]|jgi:HK97 family phage portal protein|uniref:phage portal protein n=1 Tax=Bacteroides sp. TaxID=29523 RepID=UPI003A931E1D